MRGVLRNNDLLSSLATNILCSHKFALLDTFMSCLRAVLSVCQFSHGARLTFGTSELI
jgi:hypothetical protein